MTKFSDLHPETAEGLKCWMFAEQMGIVNNETRTYTPEFYAVLETILPTLDSKIEARAKYEIVIMEYLRLSGIRLPNTESLKALSYAAGIANQTINKKQEQGISIDDIIDSHMLEDDGINE